MPTLNATVVAGQNTYGRPKQITGPDLQNRVIPALRDLYGQVQAGPFDPNTGSIPMRNRTDQEVMEEWSRRVYAQLNQDIKTYEQRKAAQQAADGVTDVPLTD